MWEAVIPALHLYNVNFEGILLKPNMVTAGSTYVHSHSIRLTHTKAYTCMPICKLPHAHARIKDRPSVSVCANAYIANKLSLNLIIATRRVRALKRWRA